MNEIIGALLGSQQWKEVPQILENRLGDPYVKRVPRIARIEGRGSCVSLWTEEVYCLRVDGKVVEVPDLLAWNTVLIEDHFDPGPPSRVHTRQALTKMGLPWLPPQLTQSGKQKIPIFVPSIPRIIDACLDQARYRMVHPENFRISTNRPVYHLRNFTRYLFLENEEQQEKLFQELQKHNQADMKVHIAGFKRKPLVTLSSLKLKTEGSFISDNQTH